MKILKNICCFYIQQSITNLIFMLFFKEKLKNLHISIVELFYMLLLQLDLLNKNSLLLHKLKFVFLNNSKDNMLRNMVYSIVQIQ
jgi:hypothetical protein